MSTGPSGWCSGPEGRCTSPRAHRVCQMRLDDPNVDLECDCDRHTKEESADQCPT